MGDLVVKKYRTILDVEASCILLYCKRVAIGVHLRFISINSVYFLESIL